jgi:hypothetical protein
LRDLAHNRWNLPDGAAGLAGFRHSLYRCAGGYHIPAIDLGEVRRQGRRQPAFVRLPWNQQDHEFERSGLTAVSVIATAAVADEMYPVKLPAPGGEVVMPDEGAKKSR